MLARTSGVARASGVVFGGAAGVGETILPCGVTATVATGAVAVAVPGKALAGGRVGLGTSVGESAKISGSGGTGVSVGAGAGVTDAERAGGVGGVDQAHAPSARTTQLSKSLILILIIIVQRARALSVCRVSRMRAFMPSSER